MKRYVVPLRGLADWQAGLGDPDLHWKRGASAMELAAAWTLARRADRGLPDDVASFLDQVPEWRGSRLQLAIPELTTPLDGNGFPSQTDLWALLHSESRTISLSVEAKAREPFGESVNRWLASGRSVRSRSVTRARRLAFLSGRLGLDERHVGDLRYQLLHRTVAALIEAESWRANAAVVLVQRFSAAPDTDISSWQDFSVFGQQLGADLRRGTPVRVSVPGAVPLYLGWLDCRFATDDELLSAFLGRAAAKRGNAFEALCALAAQEKWCWKLGCTTCGCMFFRHGLRELAAGRHPADEAWVTHDGVDGRARPAGELPPFPLAMDDQRAVVDVARTARLRTIASIAAFPDWLGYLGVILAFCRDSESESRALARSWLPQFVELLPDGSMLRNEFRERVVRDDGLSLGDLERVEGELIRAGRGMRNE